jgi:hypothetical protein
MTFIVQILPAGDYKHQNAGIIPKPSPFGKVKSAPANPADATDFGSMFSRLFGKHCLQLKRAGTLRCTEMKRPIKFRHLLGASIVTAVSGVFAPRYLAAPDVLLMLVWSLSLAAVWFAFLVAAAFWYKWRGLWLLVGAPLVFYWPIGFKMLEWACAQNVNACP